MKVSGWFRHGSEECGAATLELLAAYGENRLMFGTDFPWVMGKGEAGYAAQWQVRPIVVDSFYNYCNGYTTLLIACAPRLNLCK